MGNFRWMRLIVPCMVLLLFVCLVGTASASSVDAVWPEASGADVQSNGNLTIDCSHMDEGYVMCCVTSPTKNGMKVRVVYGGGQLMYDLNSAGEYETFPLQLGSGSYEFSLFENVKGNKYSAEGKVTLSVKLSREDAAYLVPNQYVNYLPDSLTVTKSDEITAGQSEKEIYQTVCDFMTNEFSYDFVRAQTISSGTLPEVDPCFEKRSGICQDMAAVMVCMLRVQGIPAKLVIGYADSYYHAWTVTVVGGEEVFFDPTKAIGAINAKNYQVERMY